MTWSAAAELAKADAAVEDAERLLAIATRARTLTRAGLENGVMRVPVTGNGRIEERVQMPYVFSQAYSLATRTINL